MAQVTNYATLVAYIPTFFENDEAYFTDNLDTWIGLAEATFRRKILTREQEVTATVTTDANGDVTLPSGFRRIRSAYVDGATALPLAIISGGAVKDYFPTATGGDPLYMSISGTKLHIEPYGAQSVVLTYYAVFAGLTSVNTTNWVITNYPNLYLEAVSAEACAFLGDTDGEAKHSAKAFGIMDQIEGEMGMEYYAGAGLTLSGNTP